MIRSSTLLVDSVCRNHQIKMNNITKNGKEEDKLSNVKNSHYVPKVYLKSWAKNNKIFTYDIYVAHEKSPIWKCNSTRYTSSGEFLFLYAFIKDGELSDSFEDMFSDDVESYYPKFLNRINKYENLTHSDNEFLSKLILSQYYRTMAGYNRIFKVTENAFPDIIEKVFKKLNALDNASDKTIEEIKRKISLTKPQDNLIPIDIEIIPSDENVSFLKIGTILGKSIWLQAIKQIMTSTYKELNKLSWQVIEAPLGYHFLTSDDPVMLIRYINDNEYHFLNDGFSQKYATVIFPLTPQKLLLSVNNTNRLHYSILSEHCVNLINKLIAEHAYSRIYSVGKDSNVFKYRKRVVDLDIFKMIKAMEQNLHKDYLNFEIPFINKGLENISKLKKY